MSRRRPAEFVDWISRGNLEDRLVHPSSHPAHWQCRSFISCSPKCARSPRLLNPRSTLCLFLFRLTHHLPSHFLLLWAWPPFHGFFRASFFFFFSSINILYSRSFRTSIVLIKWIWWSLNWVDATFIGPFSFSIKFFLSFIEHFSFDKIYIYIIKCTNSSFFLPFLDRSIFLFVELFFLSVRNIYKICSKILILIP